MPRYFTLEQARASLPAVRALMERAQREKARADELASAQAQAAARILGNGHGSANGSAQGQRDLQQAVTQLEATVQEIEETGCLVKDLDLGLVDWPHLRDGHEVYLCWHLGEADIGYWHEIADGFRGRQPL